MFGGGDAANDASRLGLPLELVQTAETHADVEVYPDVVPAVELFFSLRTQWRSGFGGVTGLDYAALPAVMDFRGVPAANRGGLFEDLQTMEFAVLEHQAKRSE